MNRSLRHLVGAAVLALPLLLLSSAPTRAQFYGGYGGGGFGGYGGYGGGGFGYGLGGYGFGAGLPGYGPGGLGLSVGVYGFPYGSAGFWSAPYLNPLFGMGLTPLAVQGAIGERSYLGRGSTATPTTILPSTQAGAWGGFLSTDATPRRATTTFPAPPYGGPLGTMPSADNPR